MRSALAALLLLAACGRADHGPPPPLAFDGLPLTGSLAYAHQSGFTDCREDTIEMRCRKNGVALFGFGPYNAAVDLDGSDGGGGFDHITLWNDRDQDGFLPLLLALERRGWTPCYTGVGSRGDQGIYTHQGVPARISIDLSYWGKRRLRIIPSSEPGAGC